MECVDLVHLGQHPPAGLPRAYIRSTTTSRRCSHGVRDVRPAPSDSAGKQTSYQACALFSIHLGEGMTTPLGSTRKLAVADDLVHADAHKALGAQPPAVRDTSARPPRRYYRQRSRPASGHRRPGPPARTARGSACRPLAEAADTRARSKRRSS